MIHLINFPASLALAGPGDVDGDGTPDIYAGDDFAGTCDGRLVVFSGVDASILLDIPGTPSVFEKLGESISWAGDLDADGHADLLASARGFFQGTRMVRAYSGADGSLLHEWVMPDNVGFGRGFTGLGDVNGDGHDDVALGAFNDFSDFPSVGKVFVYSGADYGLLYTIPGPVTTSGGSDQFGLELGVIDDLNGDGVKELLAGLSSDDDGGMNAGSVFVHSGADGALLLTIFGTEPEMRLGVQVDAVEDVDGDGFADILTSHPLGDVTAFNAGTVWLFSGVDGRLLFTLHGLEEIDFFGGAIAGLGDVNGDGFGDFAVGATNGGIDNDGSVDVISGACLAPAPFCSATANSTGSPALLGHEGTLRLSDNDFTLTVSGAVPQQFGVFFYGPDAADAPFGNGTLCVGGGATGIIRLNPPVAVDGNGDAQRALDFTQPPLSAGPGAVTPTSTWRFQFWYRDPQAGGSFFNLSGGLEAYFCPGG